MQRLKSLKINKFNYFLLSISILIGTILRYNFWADKPADSIEISTLGYSLGNNFLDIPLDKVITWQQLLSPLRFDATIPYSDVIHNLMTESTHPPLYFLLTHFWLKIFTADGEIVSLAVGRSLSALFGVLAIPAIFALGCFAFRSQIVGQIAAALMALSPYGIYVAQEARHYTLTILWIIISLAFLIQAIRCIQQQKKLPLWLGFFWIIINSLGIATHYFFALTLAAEGLVMSWFLLRDIKQFSQRYWCHIYIVGLGSLVGCLVWLPAVTGISGNDLTSWIDTSYDLDDIWQPILRLFVWGITMIFMLPVEGTSTFISILSGVTMLLVLVWVFPSLWQGWEVAIASPLAGLSLQILGAFLGFAILLFLFVIYGLGKDISLVARYGFVYFPVVLLLLGSSMTNCWQNNIEEKKTRSKLFENIPNFFRATGKKVVVIILIMGLFGALSVVTNYAYQKSRRADLLAQVIQTKSQAPILIAMSYKTHSEIRALMAIGLYFQRLEKKTNLPTETLEFVLAKKQENSALLPDSTIAQILTEKTRPLDLWAVNLEVNKNDLEKFNCWENPGKNIRNGQDAHSTVNYSYELYNCR
ncbi:MAG: hypothetical protein F6K54_10500 [Okeania sp. SIO3B5]|uniref:glycosyltransferase family 39 protein n=1 Tax=Okeania sp. SIO3B5 TaxID=2607811 RepID=UPI001401778E|nr:hypothetical protein [Okeania sp. SIO3B5]NEO53475.1 hypothetical protein [Okeania sp. SIO3B5]